MATVIVGDGHAAGWFFQYPIVPVPGLAAAFWKNPKFACVPPAEAANVVALWPFVSTPLLQIDMQLDGTGEIWLPFDTTMLTVTVSPAVTSNGCDW